MHEHSYTGCEHELKHCKHCDVVYCEKCGREWKQTAAINSQWFKGWRQEPIEPLPSPQWPQPHWPPYVDTGTPIPAQQQTWCHSNPNPDIPKAG